MSYSKPPKLNLTRLETSRLVLIPFTVSLCEQLMAQNFDGLKTQNLKRGMGWPDLSAIETFPKILSNLLLHDGPTGFESWIIVKKETTEIIGDIGFKGYNHIDQNIDLGYGIIEHEWKRGYAFEACSKLMEWAFSDKRVKEITARCLIDNIASARLLNKLEFRQISKSDEMIYWSKNNPELTR